MDPNLETPRLSLVRLTDTDEKSQHLQWFHQLWSDEVATSWSIHGRCKTFDESRSWMIEHMTKMDNILYAVFAKPDKPQNDCAGTSQVGDLIGSVGLRLQDNPTLPPPPPALKAAATATSSQADITAPSPFNFRVIGYSFFESAWGKGYATESCSRVLEHYAAFRAKENEVQINYIEAAVGPENPSSIRVIEKLGFEKVGFKEYTGPAYFLGGQWRSGGYDVYGKYV